MTLLGCVGPAMLNTITRPGQKNGRKRWRNNTAGTLQKYNNFPFNLSHPCGWDRGAENKRIENQDYKRVMTQFSIPPYPARKARTLWKHKNTNKYQTNTGQ